MGASESRLSDEAPKGGYHVVRVAAGSPAFHAGIEPFFDFCVGLDGAPLPPPTPAKDTGLGAWKSLEDREGQPVTINIWSAKHQAIRDVVVVPSRAWSTKATAAAGGAGGQPSLLGLSMRYCDPTQALAHVWHVLDILEGSPAESAGLVPYGDFILGWTGGPLRGEGDFYELVEAHADRSLRLYVYNADYDHTREVVIVPNRSWGGEGLLGCGVGYGLLHRIPKPDPAVRARGGPPLSPVLTAPQQSQAPIGYPRSHDIRQSIAEEEEEENEPPSYASAHANPYAHPPPSQADDAYGVTVSMHQDEGSDDEIL